MSTGAGCVEPGCDRPAHARQRCPSHYEAWRRTNPDVRIAKRASPGAPLLERVALHVDDVDENGHVRWNGYTRYGVPSIREGRQPDGRRPTHNVRALVLTNAGWPKPDGYWMAVPICDEPCCVAADHLSWTNRNRDAALTIEQTDDLIRRLNAGPVNISDEADRLNVDRKSVYWALWARGYRTARR